MLVFQALVWILGIGLAIYIAGYQLFFLGGVELIMSIIEMFNSGVSKELAETAVWGFVKMGVAGFVAWAVVFTTGAISLMIGERR